MAVADRLVLASAQVPFAAAPTTYVLMFSILGAVLIGFVVLGTLIWTWGSFLDVYEHHPARVRSAMIAILAAASVVEVAFATYGLTRQWVATVALIVNLWGGLDALLRFPAAHDFESIFCGKQITLLLIKTFSYAFGIIGFRQHVGAFLMILLIVIWGAPVLYLMALPLDPAEQVVADERDDVDIVMRVWNLITCHTERQRCLSTCKKWFRRQVLSAAQTSPIAKIALCGASQSYRRAQSKGCRSV